MTMFDLDKKTAIAFLPLEGGPDIIKFDPGLQRIYVACYSGALAVRRKNDFPPSVVGLGRIHEPA